MNNLKNLKISKELINEVLSIPKENIVDIYIDGKYLLIKKDNNRIEEHNICELAFKCQESAIDKGFDICPKMDSKGFYRLLTDDNIIGFTIEDKFIFSESISPCSSRVEAIFKAYEWILNQDVRND